MNWTRSSDTKEIDKGRIYKWEDNKIDVNV